MDNRPAHVFATTTDESRALFFNPTAAFRPSAYWFWHAIPDAETCRRQLADFKAQGFGTILIQARIAFPRHLYMSEAFIVAYRTAIGIAGELGLKTGIYDDYNWISGHAGGRTVEGRDDLRERHLFWATTEERRGAISGIQPPFVQSMGPDIMGWQYENGAVLWGGWAIEAALLHDADDVDTSRIVEDVTDRVALTGCDAVSCSYAFDGEVPAGRKLTVFVSARSASSRLINYLMPAAAQRFIAVGIEPIVAALGGLVHDPLGFVFYDQPAAGFYRWDQISGNLGNSLLFVDELRNRVENATEASFPRALISLLYGEGETTLRLRAKFYETYSTLMNEAFFGTLRAWADERGLVLTGHEILPHVGSWSLNGGFTSIDPRVAPATDFFGIDRFRHESAVDANNFTAQLAPKLGDSVARSNGRSRCVVETYASALRAPVRAAGQWELTLQTMRAQAIRLYCLGARQFLWHGVYQTDGSHTNTTPFLNPRFDFGPGINFEPWWPYHHLFAEETARISAFIEPATPHAPVAILYPLHTAWAEGPRHAHADHTGAWCEHLLALGCDFMLISEDDIGLADIRDGRLSTCSGLTFDAVVLPSATVMQSSATLDKLVGLRASGGAVWCSGAMPSVLCDGPMPVLGNWASVHLADRPDVVSIVALLETLPKRGPLLSTLTGEKPWQWIGREPDGSWRVVLFNDGPEPASCDLHLSTGFDCEFWHPATGGITNEAGLSSLNILIEPQMVWCMRLLPIDGAGGRGLTISEFASPRGPVAVLAKRWTFQAGASEATAPISVASGWEGQGFPDFSGTGIYRNRISIETAGRWVLELPRVETAAAVSLDGIEIGRRGWSPYRFELGHLAAGSYDLEIAVSNTAANRYYAGTPYQGETLDASGLLAAPRLIALEADQTGTTSC
ncbi:carbohydrate-binding protein [Rhizobium herbae]|uniref:Carbohydrate-binding protein n=1 Tax=Rhizobium herbae TaxID=508661 RepID=A0ABS4EIQ0_9HYPH|nr:carbohydrate-binding protein [Rhizobium herbae]MBP1857818.1 hypothetical protein [Rhizobium herbae]